MIKKMVIMDIRFFPHNAYLEDPVFFKLNENKSPNILSAGY